MPHDTCRRACQQQHAIHYRHVARRKETLRCHLSKLRSESQLWQVLIGLALRLNKLRNLVWGVRSKAQTKQVRSRDSEPKAKVETIRELEETQKALIIN